MSESSEQSDWARWVDRGEAALLQAVRPPVVVACDQYGRSLLMVAAALGWAEACRKLVDCGAEVDARDRWGLTALSVAAMFGRAEVAEFLLQAGADPELPALGSFRLLHWAITFRHWEVLARLVAGGAAVDAPGASGRTSLMDAASANDVDLARRLLELGADPNREWEAPVLARGRPRMEICPGFEVPRYNAMSLALGYQRTPGSRFGMVQLLLDHGARVKLDNSTVATALNSADESELRTLLRKFTGTELHAAARAGNRDEVLLCIGRGAPLDTRDEWGGTPLHAAIRGGDLRCAEALLQAGAPLEALDRSGKTSLQQAAMFGQASLVRLLLERGADPEARSSKRETPLFEAARAVHTEVVRLLLDAGAQVSLVDAILIGDNECVHGYLDAGADGEQPNPAGMTPLQAAAAVSNLPVLHYLLSHDAQVDVATEDARTALQVAVDRGQVAAVRVLLDAGADPNRVSEDRTPLGAAISDGSVDLVRLLLASGADPQGQYFRHTFLELAVARDAPDVVSALLEAAADPNWGIGLCGSPLHEAVMGGSVECARRLLEGGAQPDLENVAGRTPLGRAEAEGLTEMAELLRAFGAQISKNPPWTSPERIRTGERLRGALECLFEYRRLLPREPPQFPAFLERLLEPALAAGELRDDLLSNALWHSEGAHEKALLLLGGMSAAAPETKAAES